VEKVRPWGALWRGQLDPDSGAGASSPTPSPRVHILSRLARTAWGPSSTPEWPVIHR